jgi:hypothetical protein
MIGRLRATSIAELRVITSKLHDLWFDVTNVDYDAQRGIVSVRFLPDHQSDRIAQGDMVRELEIRCAKELRLTESEGIGRYDVNELQYLPNARTVSVATGIPLTFDVLVTDLDVALHERAKAVEE